MSETVSLTPLVDRLRASRRIFVLTGAGISTESGIPDDRDEEGEWKSKPPVIYRDFVGHARNRQRYWARSFLGWERFRGAEPNDGHRALARLEASGRVVLLVTQNVDGLHQAAGSHRVLDLHGRLDTVRCLDCDTRIARDAVQEELRSRNPEWTAADSIVAPDGDARPRRADYDAFSIYDCPACGGILKPDVVFFGESVPRDRVETAYSAVAESDLLLIAGTSLKVWSGYRFAKAAAERGVPIAIVNLGKTRADDLASVRTRGRCGEVLSSVVA